MGAVYTQLSLQERRKIENWCNAKDSILNCPEKGSAFS